MPQLKTLTIVVACLTILACATSADAKVCSTTGTGAACGQGNVFTNAVHAKLFNTSTARLESGAMTINCTESEIYGSVTNGSTGAGKVEGLLFGTCNAGGVGCVITATASEKSPWTANVVHTAGVNGKLEVETVRATSACNGGAIVCNYGAAKVGNGAVPEIPITGGEPAAVKPSNVKLTKEAGSNFLCSATALWSGEYEVTTPNSLFIE